MSSEEPRGIFTVVGSKLVHRNGTYKVSVFCQNYKKEQQFEIAIVASDSGKTTYNNAQRVTLSGTKGEILEFNLKEMTHDDLILRVKSLGGEHFERTQALDINDKRSSTFVQTDKATYKPSDLVQFRVLMVDAETRPLELPTPSCLEIFITDGGENRVKQFDGAKLERGVFQGELQLSDSPVLGNWRLNVKANDEQVTTKDFEVAEYVLPKFAVTIDAQPDANFKDGKIRATVKATYTFGKIAKGNATVTAEVEKQSYSLHWMRKPDELNNKKVSKTVAVDGVRFVEFDLREELKMSENSREQTVLLEAKYTDDLSGKEETATARVKVHNSPYKLELKKSSENFKPQLPFEITAIVQTHDRNAPVTDDQNPVYFAVKTFHEVLRKGRADSDDEIGGKRMRDGEEYEYWHEENTTTNHSVFPVGGIAKLKLDAQKKSTRFRIKATYVDAKADTSINKEESESNEYIMARVLTENPKLNENFTVEVLSTAELKNLTYQVFGRGKLIDSKTVEVAGGKNHKFEIMSTLMMIPSAHFVVFYLTSKGEVISDKVEIMFGNHLLNHIDLSLSKETAKPGEDLEIFVSTKPNSFVGLLGVDQSVLLLKSGNDIEASAVFDELKRYGEATKHNYPHQYGYGYNRKYRDFTDSRGVIITNASQPNERHEGRHKRNVMHDSDMSFRSMAVGAPLRLMSMKPSAPEAMEDVCFASMATGGAPSVSFAKKKIEIRKEFPETFIFDSFNLNSDEGKRILAKKVPDTITSWIITGFSLDPISGLAITQQPSKLNVFQPFFVSTNLPYSIKRGEVIALSVHVFNYLETDEDSQITLFNKNGDFEFVEAGDDSVAVKKRNIEVERKKMVLLKSNEGTAISFLIRPLKAGDILIKIVAEAKFAGDGLEKYLKVEPEGITIYKNEAIFVDLRQRHDFERIIELDVPEHAIADSTKIEFSIIGDILGPTLDNLDKLIRMPFGCGEQNMLNFVPNILVLEYLTTVGKLTPAIESKCKKFMEVGYQRELTYRHRDGSFSAFGESDKSGSTWLTAFVAKSFNKAAKFIHVDQKKIAEALEFLADVQCKDGSFPEVGYICHGDMQGGASKGIALTAYTLITFLENEQHAGKYKKTIEKALEYIESNSGALADTYSLAIAAYALQLADHKLKDSILAKLKSKAENKDGLTHWSKEKSAKDEDEDEGNRWRRRSHQVSSVSVEMSAYALQALLEAGGAEAEAVPVMKWLVTQRNANGGFESTQDTVVGLQALSRLAARIYVAESDLTVTVSSDTHAHAQMSLNAGNALVLQKHELPAGERRFTVKARGHGFSVLQLSYRYNVAEAAKFPRFTLTPKVDNDASSAEFLLLRVCTSFVPDAAARRSNMAVMEVALPSGFTFDADSKDELLATERVKKVETKDGDTIVLIYFDDIDEKELCTVVKAYRTHAVAKQKPAPVVIYDYYDNTRRATAFYSPLEISISDIDSK